MNQTKTTTKTKPLETFTPEQREFFNDLLATRVPRGYPTWKKRYKRFCDVWQQARARHPERDLLPPDDFLLHLYACRNGFLCAAAIKEAFAQSKSAATSIAGKKGALAKWRREQKSRKYLASKLNCSQHPRA